LYRVGHPLNSRLAEQVKTAEIFEGNQWHEPCYPEPASVGSVIQKLALTPDLPADFPSNAPRVLAV
jgi:hypothetical protein